MSHAQQAWLPSGSNVILALPELSVPSVVVFGGAGLATGLLGLLAGRQHDPDPPGPGLAPALLGLTSLGVCSALTGSPPGFGWPLLALAGLLLLFQAFRSDRLARAFAAGYARARSPRWQWAALGVGCPVTAVLLAFGAERHDVVQLPPIRPLPPGSAVTDHGRDVPLSEIVDGPWPAEDRQALACGLTGRVIQVAPADWSYNCHGWIFTGGHCLVPDWAVEWILQDNGYSPVEHPEAGDLAIYRDGRGSVCHSAQVCAVREGGQVLLESKWAWESRYVHPPDATPYGQHWTYYHSPRGGHQLAPHTDHSRTSAASLH